MRLLTSEKLANSSLWEYLSRRGKVRRLILAVAKVSYLQEKYLKQMVPHMQNHGRFQSRATAVALNNGVNAWYLMFILKPLLEKGKVLCFKCVIKPSRAHIDFDKLNW